MGRNYLWYHRGDANNAVLAAVGYVNFRRLIRWLRLLLRQILTALLVEPASNPAQDKASSRTARCISLLYSGRWPSRSLESALILRAAPSYRVREMSQTNIRVLPVSDFSGLV